LFNEKADNAVTVEAVNEYGCVSISEETFTAEYDLPNTITPNEITNSQLLAGYDIQVFNRWGSELYRGIEGWDGRYKGSLVASGTYLYTVRFLQPNGERIVLKRYVFVQY
jgi:gliding motility-associated-like protein